MVDSVVYVPNTEAKVWKEAGSGSQAKKGEHAEVQAYKQAPAESNVYMFLQDAAPCDKTCDPYFRKESLNGAKSFIFCVSRGGYAVTLDLTKGDKIAALHLGGTNHENEATLAKINKDKAFMLPEGHLPAVIYFYRGVVFLDVRPIGFPAHPLLFLGYGT